MYQTKNDRFSMWKNFNQTEKKICGEITGFFCTKSDAFIVIYGLKKDIYLSQII